MTILFREPSIRPSVRPPKTTRSAFVHSRRTAQKAPQAPFFCPCTQGNIVVSNVHNLLVLSRRTSLQDTYDMQWSYSGDVVLTTDASRALQLLDIR